MTESLFAGMDLHGNNVMIGIMDQGGKRLKHQKLECDLKRIDQFLLSYKPQIKSLAVESTFNWYWLVDGLRALSYPVQLANPAGIQQYNGLKHADDKNDAYFLAELLRLNILPTGYVYDPVLRPVRDLLRRRISLVQQRTALILSFKSLYVRTTGQAMGLSRVKAMELKEVKRLYEHPANCLIAKIQKEHMGKLDESIGLLEKAVMQSARELPSYAKLTSLPGIGRILGMTITMETGEINRFKTPGDYASYCRTVNSERLSNDRKKGENNRKCGNRYLAWSFVEAANFARRYDEDCRRWFDRKAARTRNVIAIKALACKLAKAAWHVMTHQSDYDRRRMFPELANVKSE